MRNLLIIFISLFLSLTPLSTTACSFGGIADAFKPTLKKWQKHPGPAYHDEESNGNYWEPIPKPVIKILSIDRGTAAPGASCDDAGTITLEVSLPNTSTYSISEFGIYFKTAPDKYNPAFPSYPLTSDIKDGKINIFLVWLDGAPSQQEPIDLQVEAFFVSNDLSIGESTTFTIRSDVKETNQ